MSDEPELILDRSGWDNGARFVGFRLEDPEHPAANLMWRIACHDEQGRTKSGWALLDLHGAPYPTPLDAGVLSWREARALIEHAATPTVKRRALRAIERGYRRSLRPGSGS